MAFVQTQWGMLPPIAAKDANDINRVIDRDVDGCDVRQLKCGCYETRIKWTKYFVDFEDSRENISIDPCGKHEK